jgi:uncharacterized membrane protein
MQKDIYDRLISFLLGASWAVVLFGALFTFKIFMSMGIPLAFFFTILYILISLFLILILNAFEVNRKRLDEAYKQTKLLEKIYAKHIK